MSAREDLEIRLGETAEMEFTMLNEAGDPVDLTGYTFTSQARAVVSSADTLWDLTEASGITVTALTGVVQLTITLPLSTTATRAVYDVRAEDGSGVVSYPKYGSVKILPAVTRPVTP